MLESLESNMAKVESTQARHYTQLDLDRLNIINEMRRSAGFERAMPAERPGHGRLVGQILRRRDEWIVELDAAVTALEAVQFPAPGSRLEQTLLKWISENRRAQGIVGQEAHGRDFHQRIIDRSIRLLEQVE